MTELEYVLRFALEVIEEHELQDIKNSDNWILGKSLEEQIEKAKEEVKK